MKSYLRKSSGSEYGPKCKDSDQEAVRRMELLQLPDLAHSTRLNVLVSISNVTSYVKGRPKVEVKPPSLHV